MIFELITGLKFQIKNQNNYVHLGFFQDVDNYFGVGYWGRPHGYNVKRILYTSKEQSGKSNLKSGIDTGTGADKSPIDFFFKIVRKGSEYIFYFAFSDDGPALQKAISDARWQEVGRETWIDFEGQFFSLGFKYEPESLFNRIKHRTRKHCCHSLYFDQKDQRRK